MITFDLYSSLAHINKPQFSPFWDRMNLLIPMYIIE